MKKKFCEGKHQYLKNLVMLFIFLIFSSGLAAIEPPRRGEIEKYKQDGTWQQRLDFALSLGNQKPSESAITLFNYKMDRLFYQREGKSEDEIRSLIGSIPNWKGMPTKNTVRIPVLLIAFADFKPNAADTPEVISERLFGNGDSNPPYESLRNFYNRSSYNQLDIQGNVLGWYYTEYNRGQVPQTPIGRENLIREALQYYDSQGHDFSQYDLDGNGEIDYMIVIWTGPDNGWANFWWGYYTGFNSYFQLDGKKFTYYSWQWEANPFGEEFNPRVVIHETGHALGLPDYYDYDDTVGPSGGVGGLDQMDAEWGDHNCFSKLLLDWIDPTPIPNGSKDVTLRSSGTWGDAVMIMPGITENIFREFFMVQNRFQSGNDSNTGYPNNGLLIWHVDARLDQSGNNFLYNNQYTEHKLLRLMEADGLEEIEQKKGANAGDYYVAGCEFTPKTFPNSNNYTGGVTNVCVTNISDAGFEMSCKVWLGGVPLGAPSNFNIWGDGFQVKMTWQDNSTKETKFRIQRKDGIEGEYNLVGEVGPDTTSYTDNPPIPDGGHVECWYRVRALGENGAASDFSNEAYVKMYANAPDKAPALTFPIGNIDQTRPTFTWNRVQRAASYYIAVRKDPGDNYFIIDPPDVTGTSYQCPVNLKNCQRYYWKVKACNNMGCGEYSGGYFTPSMSCAAVSINDASVMEGNSGTTNLSVNVQLAESNSLAVTVDYATRDGTAKAGVDYGSVSGTLTFPPGTTTQSIIVPVSGDTIFEGDETFLIQLSNPVQATIVDGESMVTITNDDPKPTVRFTPPAVFSAEEGSNIVFTAVIEGDFEIPLDYYWRTCPGTATPGEDYDSGSPVNQIVAQVGTREISFMVRAFADMAVEPTEFFMAAIGPSAPSSCEGQAHAEIIDKIGLAVNDVSVSEKAGSAVFTVTMSKPGTSNVTVNYATAPITAIAPGDYTAVSGTLAIPAGSASATIQVPIIDDSIRENDEQFAVRLSDAVNAAIADSEGVGTIIDDDIQVPKISIDSVTHAEGNSGTTPFIFTVTLSLPAPGPVTVKYATANGTALAGSDYIAVSGTLSFAPGEVSKTLVVQVIGDRVRERDEGFFVNLSNPTGAELYVKSGRGFITNDD